MAMTLLVFAGGCCQPLQALDCSDCSDAQKGAGIGAIIGTVAGGLIGDSTGATLTGTFIGTVLGYGAGNESDKEKMAAEIEAIRREINTVTIWVEGRGGYSFPVVLKRDGSGGYWGPRGEYYIRLPTNKELLPIYGS